MDATIIGVKLVAKAIKRPGPNTLLDTVGGSMIYSLKRE